MKADNSGAQKADLIKNRDGSSLAVVDKTPKKNNNIREVRSIRGLERVNLDLDSPRMAKAMDDLGVSNEEMDKK